MSICDNCVNYTFDEELDEYFCDAPIDEDEMSRFLRGDNKTCPYFRLDDEYSVVRKQN
ncbi:MAG: hypothetical protein IJO62_04540 [Clostridia bacterium]|nr:hypothetical protein [Clostridia bacterium]